MIYLSLFWEFFKTGLFSIGGGMATLPFLYAMSDKTGWFNTAQLTDMIAISESTPGPIGVNMSTYVGFSTAGVPGMLAATLGLLTPCVLVILIISGVLHTYRSNTYVESAFYGLRPCSVGLIAAAELLVIKISLFRFDQFEESHYISDLFNFKAILLAILLLYFTRSFRATKKLHPVFFILASAVFGIFLGF